MFLKNNIYAFIANFFIPFMVVFAMNNPNQAILIWPAVGIGAVSALVWGYKVIPALYLAQLLLSFILYPIEPFSLNNLLINNLYILISLIRCYLGAYLMRFFIDHPNPLISSKSIVKLYLIVGPLVAFASTTLSSLAKFFLNTNINNTSIFSHYVDWWFGDYIGFIIFAPLLLVVVGQPRSVWRPRYLTLLLPVLITLVFIIFLYNKTEHSDKDRLKENFTVKSELITNIINQKLTWVNEFVNTGLSHFLPFKDWENKFEKFLDSARDYDKSIIGIIWIDGSKTVKLFKPHNNNNNRFDLIKNINFTKFIQDPTSEGKTKYDENSKLFSNFYQFNKKNAKTTIIIFHDPIKLMTNTLDSYNLHDTQVQMTIDHLNKTFDIGEINKPFLNDFSIHSNLNFGNEKWKISYQPTLAYLSNNKVNSNKLVATIGLIFTGLLSMMLLIITGKNTLIDLKVKERTLTLDIKINNFKEEKIQYQKLIENHLVVLWRQNIKTNQLTYISTKVKEFYGYDQEQWLTIPNFRYDHIIKEDQKTVSDTVSAAIANRTSFELEYRFKRADSSIAWIKDVVTYNKDKKGNAQLVGLMIDTTETHEAKNKQNISESKYGILFKYAPEPMILIDLESHLFKDSNDKANALFGLDNILGTLKLSDLSPIKQSDGSLTISRLEKIYKILFTKNMYKFEWKMYNKSHEEIICKVEFIKLPETKNNLILASIIDVTENRQHERKINQLAYYDQLTSLPNREYFYSKFEFFHQLAKNKNQFGTIIYLDLDRFKLLNDSLGHQTGDKLLEMVAKRIKNTSRNNDFCARLGGDEFIILTRSLENRIQAALEQSLVKSELILEALNEPYQLDDYEHFITPSIGISVFPNNNASLDEIVHQADIAMYASKHKGKNTITVFQENMIQQVAKKLLLEKAIKDAIDKNEFELHYQIKVDEHKNTSSAEALLRWSRLKEFSINTEKLIETIDTVGLTNELGNWVLDQACYQLKKWEGKSTIKSISINISPKQLHQKLFVEQIISVVSNYKIKPERITLELTETVLFDNQKVLIRKLQELRKHGIKISLDDFGTGYSSLAYLQKLPIDELKIDKMFIDNLTPEKPSQYVIKAILTLAKSMDIELIVEGIETKQQFEILKELGVKYFQGYYFAKAQTAKELNQLY
jgi:diguanylate cyclase (GGDEF)-like protein